MIKAIILIAYFISLYLTIFWLLILLDKGVKIKPAKLKSYPLVTVCIPAYNEEGRIAETIDSVLSLDYPKDKIELIIVNDGSKDNTLGDIKSTIKNYPGRNIVVIDQKNQGKGAAMNNALKRAKGKFFVPLDADSIVEPEALKIILPHFSTENIAAVLPMIKIQHKSTLMRKIQHCEYLINFFFKRIMNHLNCVHVAPGPFSVYRKDIIQGLGGFDEKCLVEDLEMAVKIQKSNFEILQILETSVLTKAPGNFIQFYKQRNRWYKGSLLTVFNYRNLLFNRAYGDFGILQLPMVFISAILSVTLLVVVFVWTTVKPFILRLHDWSYVKFDLGPLVSKGIHDFSFLNLNFVPMFYGITIMVFAMIFLVLAHHNAGEKIRHNKKSVFFYIVVYPIMIAIIWTGVIIDLIRGKIQKW